MNLGALDVSADTGGLVDRRDTIRFPVRQELKYKILPSKATASSGNGHTINMGSGGILFTTEEKLPLGRQVEISVNWPARLDGTCPLKFVATGHVIRSDANQAAVRIERYEFKTRGQTNGTS
jgi:PilZ domain-containing protein